MEDMFVLVGGHMWGPPPNDCQDSLFVTHHTQCNGTTDAVLLFRSKVGSESSLNLWIICEIFSFIMLPFLSSLQKLNPEKVYHMVVAPCFDKKFEAVREEFYNSLLESRDVDCVLTSGLLLLI